MIFSSARTKLATRSTPKRIYRGLHGEAHEHTCACGLIISLLSSLILFQPLKTCVVVVLELKGLLCSKEVKKDGGVRVLCNMAVVALWH